MTNDESQMWKESRNPNDVSEIGGSDFAMFLRVSLLA
jgi:hypothetical protein